MADCVEIVDGTGIAPDNETILVDPATGKAKVGLVRTPAYGSLGRSLVAGTELDVNCALEGGLEVTDSGLAIQSSSNGAGTRYIGTDHTEIVSPQIGDIYYEVA